MMNLSTGNLALANKNGKSVSTSALGTSSAASVDRWAVVMDLLAQSRRSTPTGGRQEAGDQGLSSLEPAGLSAKRHSKQLDKFKLAARSAAAASKSQRVAHGNLQSGPTNQQATHSSSNQMRSNSPAAGSVPLQMSNSIPIGPPTSGPAGGQQPYHQLDTSFLGHTQLMAGEQSSPTATHLHHTKSLPVGGKQSLPVSQEQLMMMSGAHQQTYAHHMQQTQPAQAQQPQQVPLHHQQPSSSLANAHGSRQGAHPVQHQHHQLLNIGAQQIHSTSGKSDKMHAKVKSAQSH